MKAILALEDGTIFRGKAFGAKGETAGEVVFNTAMSGYQEVLTDPSYEGQIVAMTYPHIGNYGVNPADFESWRPYVAGFVVRECSPVTSNWRSAASLDEFLTAHGIVGIEEVDTRKLTRHLRERGCLRGAIVSRAASAEAVVSKARACPQMVGRDLVQVVTAHQPYEWKQPRYRLLGKPDPRETTPEARLPYVEESPKVAYEQALLLPARRYPDTCRVVALDLGQKHNILRRLTAYGCQVKVLAGSATPDEILASEADGLFLSNGPGDPEPVTYVIEAVQALAGRIPIFGICLGHQILGLAYGARTYKLKFGHHGANHPVRNVDTRKVEITSQNHNFAVDQASLAGTGLRVTHINLNDNTIEGLRHEDHPSFTVQYHPENSPGPHDADYLFAQFLDLMLAWRRRRA